MELFSNFPPHEREQMKEDFKGKIAVSFPSAYFRKAPGAQSPLWQEVSRIDEQGCVAKTGPRHLVDKLINYLEKMELEYSVIQL